MWAWEEEVGQHQQHQHPLQHQDEHPQGGAGGGQGGQGTAPTVAEALAARSRAEYFGGRGADAPQHWPEARLAAHAECFRQILVRCPTFA
jgi:hypothetical protein